MNYFLHVVTTVRLSIPAAQDRDVDDFYSNCGNFGSAIFRVFWEDLRKSNTGTTVNRRLGQLAFIYTDVELLAKEGPQYTHQ